MYHVVAKSSKYRPGLCRDLRKQKRVFTVTVHRTVQAYFYLWLFALSLFTIQPYLRQYVFYNFLLLFRLIFGSLTTLTEYKLENQLTFDLNGMTFAELNKNCMLKITNKNEF